MEMQYYTIHDIWEAQEQCAKHLGFSPKNRQIDILETHHEYVKTGDGREKLLITRLLFNVYGTFTHYGVFRYEYNLDRKSGKEEFRLIKSEKEIISL